MNYGFISRVLMCNSLNPSHLFKPMHRKVTPNKDRSTIRMTPLYLLFSLYLSATQKNKKKKKLFFFRSFSTQNSKTLSHHCSISMATASKHCVPHLRYRRSSDTFLSLSFNRWRCYRRCHHHWWPPGPHLFLFIVFSLLFFFLFLFLFSF